MCIRDSPSGPCPGYRCRRAWPSKSPPRWIFPPRWGPGSHSVRGPAPAAPLSLIHICHQPPHLPAGLRIPSQSGPPYSPHGGHGGILSFFPRSFFRSVPVLTPPPDFLTCGYTGRCIPLETASPSFFSTAGRVFHSFHRVFHRVLC